MGMALIIVGTAGMALLVSSRSIGSRALLLQKLCDKWREYAPTRSSDSLALLRGTLHDDTPGAVSLAGNRLLAVLALLSLIISDVLVA